VCCWIESHVTDNYGRPGTSGSPHREDGGQSGMGMSEDECQPRKAGGQDKGQFIKEEANQEKMEAKMDIAINTIQERKGGYDKSWPRRN
jgi:hypothetical protein